MFQTLGDPHLGRTFIHGVPLHRRGDREALIWRQFENELYCAKTPYHIMMGDLFDKSVVPFDVILRAAFIYKEAARVYPDTTFVILQGNHDVSRDLERVSAFDVFAELVHGINNITVVREPTQIDDMLFVPYDPLTPADELVRECGWVGTKMAFGHWDTIEAGGIRYFNLIPTQALAEMGIKQAYTGHVHKPSKFTRDGVEVVGTGSMQPYAHGEEVNEDLYVTRTLDEVQKDQTIYGNKCLRVILKQGEVLDDNIDCLQLTIKREEQEEVPDAVTLGDFNMADLFVSAFDAVGVAPAFRQRVLDRYAAATLSS